MQNDQLQNIIGQLSEIYGGGYIKVSGAFYNTGESAGQGGGSSGWNPAKSDLTPLVLLEREKKLAL